MDNPKKTSTSQRPSLYPESREEIKRITEQLQARVDLANKNSSLPPPSLESIQQRLSGNWTCIFHNTKKKEEPEDEGEQ